MTNGDYLKLVLTFWKPSTITFKLLESGDIGLYRNEDNYPLYTGHSFDDIITKLRIYMSEMLMNDRINNKQDQ